ncbi:MAG TPA: inositol monophosphatase family protein [Acidimicrobiales bacterium]|jgi:histidinol phosphatase-like enzyme (inositol monophosphatase family)|nr:inositol monophosphatase family protein [Acidimicrobiales bacterium]
MAYSPDSAPPADPELLDFAVALTRKAGELTLGYFRSSDLVVDRKGDGTPVTEADRGAERLIRSELEARFPDDGILGEEEAERPGATGRKWTLDPIDGTKPFTHGVPLYCNLLAFDDEHGPAIGVINMPALGETVYAGRGLGCFLNGAPCHVNDRDTIDERAFFSSSGLGSYWPDGALDRVRKAGFQVRTWGDGYGFALVATGRIDVMADPVAEPYDIAPMPVILAEAGGRFTAWSGAESVTEHDGVATNGRLHDAVLALLDRST